MVSNWPLNPRQSWGVNVTTTSCKSVILGTVECNRELQYAHYDVYCSDGISERGSKYAGTDYVCNLERSATERRVYFVASRCLICIAWMELLSHMTPGDSRDTCSLIFCVCTTDKGGSYSVSSARKFGAGDGGLRPLLSSLRRTVHKLALVLMRMLMLVRALTLVLTQETSGFSCRAMHSDSGVTRRAWCGGDVTTLRSISVRDTAKDMPDMAMHANTPSVSTSRWISFSSLSIKKMHASTNASAIPYSADLVNGDPPHTWTLCGNGWLWPTAMMSLFIGPGEFPGAGVNQGLFASPEPPVHYMFSVVCISLVGIAVVFAAVCKGCQAGAVPGLSIESKSPTVSPTSATVLEGGWRRHRLRGCPKKRSMYSLGGLSRRGMGAVLVLLRVSATDQGRATGCCRCAVQWK